MAKKTVKPKRTDEQKRAAKDAKLQQRAFQYAQDQFVQDEAGNVKPADPGPSIYDV